jgi:hypothetical protein
LPRPSTGRAARSKSRGVSFTPSVTEVEGAGAMDRRPPRGKNQHALFDHLVGARGFALKLRPLPLLVSDRSGDRPKSTRPSARGCRGLRPSWRFAPGAGWLVQLQ